MADIPAFHRRFRAEIERLTGDHPEKCMYVTSIANLVDSNTASGCVSEVNLEIAAKGFISGTMRESTPAEIEAYIARGESFRARANAQTQRERRPTMHYVSEGR